MMFLKCTNIKQKCVLSCFVKQSYLISDYICNWIHRKGSFSWDLKTTGTTFQCIRLSWSIWKKKEGEKLVLGFLNTLLKLRIRLKKISEERFWYAWYLFPYPAEQNSGGHVSLHECAFKKIKEAVYQFEGYGEQVCER